MSWEATVRVWRGPPGVPVEGLRADGDDPAPVRAGIEHEYVVWADGAQADFRVLLPQVAGHLRSLDPGDPRVRRLPSGMSLTADGREAELATPPVPWATGAPQRLDRLLASERSELARTLAAHGTGDRLSGFSTHVNLSVPDDRVVELGRTFARTCGLAVAAAAEPRTSAGLLVRPRRGRLEIGGEYAEGGHLVALVTFVGAAVGALLDGSPPPASLPEPLVVPSREKFGWYLPVEGAYAALLASPTEARRVLADAWAWARPSCVGAGVDPGPVDGLVAGGRLRLEDDRPADECTVGETPSAVPHGSGQEGPDTGPRRLAGGLLAETVWLTWQHAVWGFFDGSRAVYAVLPAGQEAEFLAGLDAGRYDDDVRRLLARRHPRRRLLVNAQLAGAAWWHEVRPGALVPAERTPDGSVPPVSYRRAARQHRAATRAGRHDPPSVR